MEMQSRTDNGCTVVTASGRLDAQSAPEAEATLAGIIAGGATRLVLDLAAIDYVSSAGLRILLTTARKVARANGKFVLCGLQPDVRRVFDTSGLLSVFQVVDSDAAAVELASA